MADLKNCLSFVFLYESKVSNFVLKLLNYYNINSVECLEKWGGTGGWDPGKTAGRVWETGEERAGSRISMMVGSGREIQKGKLSLFVTGYHPVKETNPTTFLDYHLTFSEA